jgi:hypothetical protein
MKLRRLRYFNCDNCGKGFCHYPFHREGGEFCCKECADAAHPPDFHPAMNCPECDAPYGFCDHNVIGGTGRDEA